MNKAVKQGKSINLVAEFFNVTRQTVWYWKSETLKSNFKDLPRKTRPSKITVEIEINILYMRINFKWGTARIQQGLMNLPEFMLEGMEVVVQNLKLSRTSINNVLKKYKLNGYQKKYKKWKFFRAKSPNELWQVDLKEFKFEGKKYYIFVVIDDYSRYILLLSLFDHCPKTKELTYVLENLSVKPKNILADNGDNSGKNGKSGVKGAGLNPFLHTPTIHKIKARLKELLEIWLKNLLIY